MRRCSSYPLRWLALAMLACTVERPLVSDLQEQDRRASQPSSTQPPRVFFIPDTAPAPTPGSSAEGTARPSGIAGAGGSQPRRAGTDGGRALAEPGGGENAIPTVPGARLAVVAGSSTSVAAARGLLRLASDPDGDALRVESAGAAGAALGGGAVTVATELGGSLSVSADGAFTYEPPPGVVAELDRSPFVVTDGRGASVQAELVLSITPGTLGGQPGFEIGGGSAERFIGSSVTGVGDFNGDGLDDVLVAARSGGRDIGHLLLGSRAPGNVDLNDGDSVLIIGETPGLEPLSVVVSPAGYVNDDRFADILIGMHQEPSGDEPEDELAGKAYVIFGSESPPGEIELSTLAAEQRGFVIQGAAGQDRLGFSVAAAGNVNGSGGDDLLIGAIASSAADGELASDGKAYVVFGKNSFTPVSLADLGNEGFRLDGESEEGGQTGAAVTGLGDWNGDGRADIAVSAPQLNGAAGRVYVVYGRAGGGVVELGDVAFGVGGFAIDGQFEGEQAGSTLQNGGQLGGSELSDLVIGSSNPTGISGAGRTVVVYGTPGAGRVQIAQIEGGNELGFVVSAESAANASGLSLAGPGDFNGDGAGDLLIGASDQGPAGSGAAYVLFGSSALRGGVALSGLTTDLGFTVRSQPPAGARLGFAAAAAGDVNGDGYPDIILGAPGHDDSAGRAYVLLGHP